MRISSHTSDVLKHMHGDEGRVRVFAWTRLTPPYMCIMEAGECAMALIAQAAPPQAPLTWMPTKAVQKEKESYIPFEDGVKAVHPDR